MKPYISDGKSKLTIFYVNYICLVIVFANKDLSSMHKGTKFYFMLIRGSNGTE